MRKLLYSILIFPLLLAFVGCNNLLDIKPVNSMIPVSIEDFESLLIGGYPKSEFFMKTEYSTDNVYANLNTMYGIDKSNEPFFVWASTHELPTATTDPYWGTLYKTIFYANSVLDDFEKRIPAEAEKEFAGAGYGTFKTAVGEAVVARLEPIQKNFKDLQNNKDYLDAIIKEGAQKAERIANRTLDKVQKKIGFPLTIR